MLPMMKEKMMDPNGFTPNTIPIYVKFSPASLAASSG